MKKMWISFLALLITSVMIFSSACAIPTQDETAMLEDLLEKLDAVEGEITFVTKDGESVNIQITKESLDDTAEEKVTGDDTKNKEVVSDKQADILPSIGSKEDIFEMLGVLEQAKKLREQGFSWSKTAQELGYTADSMYAQLEEQAEQKLKNAVENGLISQEQAEKKLAEFMSVICKWVDKIFADGSTGPSLSDYLPVLDSIEDVFKTLGVWEKAHLLREQDIAWSHVAAELGYTADSMYTHLEACIETTLKNAQAAGLINQEQLEYKLKYYSDIAMKRVKEIFADTADAIQADISVVVPSIESIEDVFGILGILEDAAALREQGLSWAKTAFELGYTEESMYRKLYETVERELHDAKIAGQITYEQYKEMLEDFSVKAKAWTQEIFADAELTTVAG